MSFVFSVADFDPKRTWTDFSEHMATLHSPRHRANLQTVIDHARGEVERDIPAIMATLQERPVYHFWSWHGVDAAPKTREEIVAYYEQYVASGQALIESRKTRVVVSDDHVASESVITNIHAGEIADGYGFQIEDKDAVYATRMRNMVLWNMDENAKAHGEDAYTWRRPEDCVRLAPGEIPQSYIDYMAEIGKSVPGL